MLKNCYNEQNKIGFCSMFNQRHRDKIYSCGHKYRDTLHDFIFAKVVRNMAFKSHSPTYYASKS